MFDHGKNEEKIGSAEQDLPALRAALYMAQEMGAGMG